MKSEFKHAGGRVNPSNFYSKPRPAVQRQKAVCTEDWKPNKPGFHKQ